MKFYTIIFIKILGFPPIDP